MVGVPKRGSRGDRAGCAVSGGGSAARGGACLPGCCCWGGAHCWLSRATGSRCSSEAEAGPREDRSARQRAKPLCGGKRAPLPPPSAALHEVASAARAHHQRSTLAIIPFQSCLAAGKPRTRAADFVLPLRVASSCGTKTVRSPKGAAADVHPCGRPRSCRCCRRRCCLRHTLHCCSSRPPPCLFTLLQQRGKAW